MAELPFQDRAGQRVESIDAWNRSRNQQRNYETLLQIFGLRTQPQNISRPVQQQDCWRMSFEIEHAGVFDVQGNADPLAGLCQDCAGVPMLVNLGESRVTVPVICCQGLDQNIWFEAINT